MKEAERRDAKRQKIEQRVEDKKIVAEVAHVHKTEGAEAAKKKARDLLPGKEIIPRLQADPELTQPVLTPRGSPEDLGPQEQPDSHAADRPWHGVGPKAHKAPKKNLADLQHTTKEAVVLGDVDIEEQRAIEKSIKESSAERSHSLSGSGLLPSGSGSGGTGAPSKPKKRSAGLSKPASDKGKQELQKSLESSDDDA